MPDLMLSMENVLSATLPSESVAISTPEIGMFLFYRSTKNV